MSGEIGDIQDIFDKRQDNFALVLQALSQDGETDRLSNLNSSQIDWVFKMLVTHQLKFYNMYKHVNRLCNSKKVKINKELKHKFDMRNQLIPNLMETYLNLAVSETEVAKDSLINLIGKMTQSDLERERYRIRNLEEKI